MCCTEFDPSHDVLQELLEVEQADNVWRTKKPIATNGRREDYVRLPFVDDLCLRTAMQGFLRRKLPSEAKLTGRQIKSSKCQPCHDQSILPCYLYLKTIYNQRNFHMNAIQGHAYQGMVGLHMCVPEIFGIIAFS